MGLDVVLISFSLILPVPDDAVLLIPATSPRVQLKVVPATEERGVKSNCTLLQIVAGLGFGLLSSGSADIVIVAINEFADEHTPLATIAR